VTDCWKNLRLLIAKKKFKNNGGKEMKKTSKVLLIMMLCALIILTFGACTKNSAQPNGEPNVSHGSETEQNNEELSSDQDGQDNSGSGDDQANDESGSGSKVAAKVLTDNYPLEISNYLEENKAKETQRAFNVNNKTYIVLTMGEQSTGGYSIELKDLVLRDSGLHVYVKYNKPGEIAATVLTYPTLVIETDDIYEGH